MYIVHTRITDNSTAVLHNNDYLPISLNQTVVLSSLVSAFWSVLLAAHSPTPRHIKSATNFYETCGYSDPTI